jgi:hypothetical protein
VQTAYTHLISTLPLSQTTKNNKTKRNPKTDNTGRFLDAGILTANLKHFTAEGISQLSLRLGLNSTSASIHCLAAVHCHKTNAANSTTYRSAVVAWHDSTRAHRNHHEFQQTTGTSTTHNKQLVPSLRLSRCAFGSTRATSQGLLPSQGLQPSQAH